VVSVDLNATIEVHRKSPKNINGIQAREMLNPSRITCQSFFIVFLTFPIIYILPALEYGVISHVKIFIIFLHNCHRVRKLNSYNQ